MKKLNSFAMFYLGASILLSACSLKVPGLTSETDTPLDIKGYHIGDSQSICNGKSISKKNNVSLCNPNISSLANIPVEKSTFAFYDGRLSYISIKLSQSQGFSQASVLEALSRKFGAPVGNAATRKYMWTNKSDSLVLDEIRGMLTLMGEDVEKIQGSVAAYDQKDL